MAEIEPWQRTAVSPNIGQRLIAVRAALEVRKLEIDQVLLIDPLASPTGTMAGGTGRPSNRRDCRTGWKGSPLPRCLTGQPEKSSCRAIHNEAHLAG